MIYLEFELISHSTKIANSKKIFGLDNQFNEKYLYPYLHREKFGLHMSDIYPSLVFTSGLVRKINRK